MKRLFTSTGLFSLTWLSGLPHRHATCTGPIRRPKLTTRHSWQPLCHRSYHTCVPFHNEGQTWVPDCTMPFAGRMREGTGALSSSARIHLISALLSLRGHGKRSMKLTSCSDLQMMVVTT